MITCYICKTQYPGDQNNYFGTKNCATYLDKLTDILICSDKSDYNQYKFDGNNSIFDGMRLKDYICDDCIAELIITNVISLEI